MFAMIFESAFDCKAIFGGFTGSCMMHGIKRGLYSNEAGMGFLSERGSDCRCFPSCKARAGSDALCFHRHLADLYRDCIYVPVLRRFFGPETAARPMCRPPWQKTSRRIRPSLPVRSHVAFSFTTLIGNYSYCEGCLRFILNRAVSRGGILAFRSLATLLVFVGAIANAGTVWNLADMTQGLMVLVNLPVILILAKPAFLCLEDYCKQKKDGKKSCIHCKRRRH